MKIAADLIKHCGVTPEVLTTYYPTTMYKMYQIQCPKCGISTGAKRRLNDAIQEWNNPFTVRLNKKESFHG